MPKAKIRIEDVCKTYTVRKHVDAVKHASLTVNEGEVVVIIGPSGSGKSTLLRSVNKLENITSGKIFIDDVEVSNPNTDIRKIRENVGMVFQSFNLFPHLTVLKNITIAQEKVKKISKEEAEKKARDLLSRVGLSEDRKSVV